MVGLGDISSIEYTGSENRHFVLSELEVGTYKLKNGRSRGDFLLRYLEFYCPYMEEVN